MRKVLENSFYNLAGQVLPMILGLIVVPILIKDIGKELFGLLTVIWVFVGYFSLFDLGLGRAITRLTVEFLKKNEDQNIRSLFWIAIRWMGYISGSVVLIMFFFSESIVQKVFKIQDIYKPDVILAIKILAISVPLVAWQGALRGFLEAYTKFKFLNLIQSMMGLYTFGSPLIAWGFHQSLTSIVCFIVVGRTLFLGIHLIYIYKKWPWIFKSSPENINTVEQEQIIIQRIKHFGGWLTVSNIIGPIMVYFDRFILGSLVSMAQVAFYTTPYEFVSRISILPSSLVRVLFPEFSKHISSQDGHQKIVDLYFLSLKLLFVILIIPCAGLVYFGKEGLSFWLGSDFAESAFPILQILTIGIFFNSLALIPFTLVQSTEKVDWTAKLHLLELPLYLGALWWMIKLYNLIGSAIVWTVRMVVDEMALSLMIEKSGSFKINSWGFKFKLYFLSAIIFGMGFLNLSVLIRAMMLGLLILMAFYFIWKNKKPIFKH
jgi:O-antigen/teichoic acid export membrane protein